MKKIIVLLSALVSLSAFASDVTGRSTLTMYMDYQNGFTSINLMDHGGTINGQSGIGRNGMIYLEREGSLLKGTAAGGFVRVTCTDSECTGMVGSQNVRMALKNDRGEINVKGSLKSRYAEATQGAERIEVRGNGYLSLKRTADGMYEGEGSITADPRTRFHAKLSMEGTLKNLDPALFIVYLVSPFMN